MASEPDDAPAMSSSAAECIKCVSFERTPERGRTGGRVLEVDGVWGEEGGTGLMPGDLDELFSCIWLEEADMPACALDGDVFELLGDPAAALSRIEEDLDGRMSGEGRGPLRAEGEGSGCRC